jgi:hypothetical protein
MCSVAQIIEHRLSRQSLVRRAEPAGTPIETPEGVFNLIAFESVSTRCRTWRSPSAAWAISTPMAHRSNRPSRRSCACTAATCWVTSSPTSIRRPAVHLHRAPAPGVHAGDPARRPRRDRLPPTRGLDKLRLLTNQPKSLPALDAFGLEIVETVGIEHA